MTRTRRQVWCPPTARVFANARHESARYYECASIGAGNKGTTERAFCDP